MYATGNKKMLNNDIFNKNQGNVRGIFIGHYPLLQHETMVQLSINVL